MPALKWPVTSDELKAAGYEYDGDATCRGCQAPIEFWITPNWKKMPMSILKTSDRNSSIAAMMKDPGDKRQPHFIDCENAADFRKRQ